MNDETRDLLEKLAQLDETEHPVAVQELITDARDMLDNEYEHLPEPPPDCPICGGDLDKRINRKAWVEIFTCPRCDWTDEWDGPEPYHPASIRY